MQPNSTFFDEVTVPFQKNYDGVVFPVVLSPTAVDSADLSDLTAAIKEEKPWLEGLLHKHGVILLRGFDALVTASDFNDVVEEFGYEELPYIGGAALRHVIVGRVYTANESPPDRKIPFHHEMSHLPAYPAKIFFFCEEEAAAGGETPIVLSHIIYEKMKVKYPEFVENLEKHGLTYTRVMANEDDLNSSIGRGWKSSFGTTDKSIAEQRAAELKMRLEWMDEGVITITGPMAAIKYDETRNRKTWFNNMAGTYAGWKDKLNDGTKSVTFGNGSNLPDDIIIDCLKIMDQESVIDCLKIMDQESVDIPWRKGDVMLLDNMAILHARKSFTPPRRILASICKN